ncbi:MAG: ATP-binding protein [Ghiorsea sp.]
MLYRPLGKIERQINLQYDALEEAVSLRTEALELSNEELKSFAYSVSHDLRGPLRAIDGFSLALFEDYHDKLGDDAKACIQRIRTSSQRMASLIDAMLILSRVSQVELHYIEINLSKIAQETIEQLQREEPERYVHVSIAPNMTALGDPSLLRQVIENLLSNAWKFTSTRQHPEISFFSQFENGQTIYQVKDNGVGFNQAYHDKLFTPFQRLHKQDEFTGTGIGLPIVQRIIHRHGGIISAESAIDKGASFYFNLPNIKEVY